MLNTLGIVLASGSRAQQAKMRRRLGGKTLLEWVIRRVTDSQRLSGVIAVVGNSQDEQWIAELVPPDVPVFACRQRDCLSRVAAALDEYPAEAVVVVPVTHPFIDGALIDRLITSAEAGAAVDYVSYCSRDGKSLIHSPLGVFAEWVGVKALKHAAAEATLPMDRERVTRYLYSHPETFDLRLVRLPQELDWGEVRLAADSDEDWEHIQAIYDALGPDRLDMRRMAELLESSSWFAQGSKR